MALRRKGLRLCSTARRLIRSTCRPNTYLQLSLNPDEVEQSMPWSWPESYKYVYVAFGGEVVTKAGAEQRELHNVPLPAERLYPIHGYTDR